MFNNFLREDGERRHGNSSRFEAGSRYWSGGGRGGSIERWLSRLLISLCSMTS